MDKDYNKILGYEPSEYQAKIFDFVRHGVGNGFVKARAGSGKTTTLVSAMKLIPDDRRCLFLAFNRAVKEEIAKKVSGHKNCTVRTLHGLGMAVLQEHLGCDAEFDDNKYAKWLREAAGDACDTHAVMTLFNFCRQWLCQSRKDIERCAKRYGLGCDAATEDLVLGLMSYGRDNPGKIDYADMVWLPCELGISPKRLRYDWVFNDEVQDYSVAYMHLFKKCFRRGGRFISCGDDYQAINQFAGASDVAWNSLMTAPNTTVFSLPVSYRCAKVIVRSVQDIVPDIMPRNGAPEGEIVKDSSLSDIGPEDMVLSRTNAPLLRLFGILAGRGVKCYIKGQDHTRDALLGIVDRFGGSGRIGCEFEHDGLVPRMCADMMARRDEDLADGIGVEEANRSPLVTSMFDTVQSVEALASGCGDSVEALRRKIDIVFSQPECGVCLSTVHKAKGLESDRVHILNYEDMEASTAPEAKNIIYVAKTRARNSLFFVSEREFPAAKAERRRSGEDMFADVEAGLRRLYGDAPVAAAARKSTAAADAGMECRADEGIENVPKDVRKDASQRDSVIMELFS